MNKLAPSVKIYISNSKMKNAGRGVFALKNIRKGDLIESCPVIEVPEYETAAITEGILITYLYYFGKKKDRSVIALGFGAIYNHTYLPNAVYNEKPKEKLLEFVAIKNIKKGEEITVNYNQNEQGAKIPLWFDI